MIPTVLLVGNPNVGKSALFSRLTGTKVISSNFPGTTVSILRGMLETASRGIRKNYELIDTPGLYSLTEKTETTRRGSRFVIEHADIIINVIDATNLERNLFLTTQLLALKKPMIVVLNMWDEAQYHGITIDIPLLSQELGVPVVPTTSISGHGVLRLVTQLTALQGNSKNKQHTPLASHWPDISHLVKHVQTVSKRTKKPLEHFATLTLHPVWGTCIALGCLITTFLCIFFLSEALESSITALFDFFLTTPLTFLHKHLASFPALQSFLIGTVENGTIDYQQAMGLLTTGIYIPLGQVAPPVTAFYFAMGILEDCGYLPRLATLADTMMHRYALHGFALIPMLLGAGCNVTGIIGTRVLDNRKQRIITAILLSITIPCASQTGFIVAMAHRMGGLYLTLLFVLLALTWHVLGTILGRREKQNYQEMIIEIPPLRAPRLRPSLIKLSVRVRNFLSDAIPITILGIALLIILNNNNVFSLLGASTFAFLHKLWGLPAEVIPALCMGLFRKEIALSYLKAIPNLSQAQAFISTLILTLWFPCVSVYTVLYKEFGMKSLLWMVGLMFTVSTILATLAHTLLQVLTL